MSTTTATTAGTEISERVAQLRELAKTDAVAAQNQAWALFKQLGADAAGEREGSSVKLAELFGYGTPASPVGPTDGILVAPLIQPGVDVGLRALTARWMPWSGKSFDPTTQTGTNRLISSAKAPLKVLFPTYKTRPALDSGVLAFDFQTRVEQGASEPAVDVLVIDYEPVEANPDLIIRHIRDELVEIVPGTNLGRILYRTKNGYANIGYFALKTPVS
jgi:hypothetical protein